MQVLRLGLVIGVLLCALVVVPVALGEPDDVAEITYLEAWQAPGNETSFDEAVDVQSAIDDESMTRATGLDATDMLVIEMRIRGFDEAVRTANGSSTTDQFQHALSEHGSLEISQTDMGPQKAPLEIDALDESGVTVFPDDANETYYVAIDIDEANVTRNEYTEALDTERTHRFAIVAQLDANSSLRATNDVAGTAIEPRSATVTAAADGNLHVRSQPNQTVSGTTNLGSGSTITLVLTGEANPLTASNESFQVTSEATVRLSDGGFRYEATFDSTFDLTDVSTSATNTTFDVRADGGSLLDAPVPAVVADRRASVETHEVVEDEEIAGVNVTASLSAGGFVVLFEESVDGKVIGFTPYLGRGTHTETVYLAQPTDADELVVVGYRDANHNEWFDGPDTDSPYTDGEPVDTVQIDVDLSGTDLPGDTRTPEDSPQATPVATDSSDHEIGAWIATGNPLYWTLLGVVGVIGIGMLVVSVYRRQD